MWTITFNTSLNEDWQNSKDTWTKNNKVILQGCERKWMKNKGFSRYQPMLARLPSFKGYIWIWSFKILRLWYRKNSKDTYEGEPIDLLYDAVDSLSNKLILQDSETREIAASWEETLVMSQISWTFALQWFFQNIEGFDIERIQRIHRMVNNVTCLKRYLRL